MLLNYLQAGLKQAKYEILSDDRSYYGEIPASPGVMANAETLEECREQLQEVLGEWVLIRIAKGLSVPSKDF